MLANGSYIHEHDAYSAEQNMSKDVIIPVFYREKQFNPQKSEKERRSIYEEYDAAKFLIPGDDKTVHIERVTEEHMRRWPRQWEAYKSGQDQSTGMPLSAWYMIQNHPALLEEMLSLKIRTVEDLANLAEGTARNLPWGLDWKKRAQEEVKTRVSREEADKVSEGLRMQLAEMEKRMAVMAEQLAANASANVEPLRRGPGRPPKQE